VILDKIYLNYTRNDDYMPSSQEKCVPLQGKGVGTILLASNLEWN